MKRALQSPCTRTVLVRVALRTVMNWTAKSGSAWRQLTERSEKNWRAWMLNGITPQREMGACDVAALKRNTALAEHYRVNGTPAIIFEDGSRFAGAVDLDRLAKKLDEVAAAAAAAPKKG